MERINIQEKNLQAAIFQFIFPFSFKNGWEQRILPFLKQEHFKHFRLDLLEDEEAYYGKFHVSHRDMEAYFLSFTNRILFPSSEDQKGLHRYSKALNKKGILRTDLVAIPFLIHSIDITLCPYELGFMTIRTEVCEAGSMPLSYVLEFADRFRVLEPRSERDRKTKIECDGKRFDELEVFIFDFLFHGLTEFFEKKIKKESYFETFPFFEDEKMYVQSLLALKENEAIDLADVYRAGSLSGLTFDGKPYVSANNLAYIQEYLKGNCYYRWAPDTYFVTEEHIFICITNENSIHKLASKVYGEFYYGVVLNLFHKMVLLKLAHHYAVLDIERDTEEMEKLIYSINTFTAHFFSLDLVTQSKNQEIFFHLRKTFNIDILYKNAKQTLSSLFKYQENVNSKKESLLLLILTLYSVTGQMFGMTLVTGDFIGKIQWNHIMNYNPVENLAFFTAISGMIISFILGIQGVYQWIIDRRNRKNWMKQTIFSSIEDDD